MNEEKKKIPLPDNFPTRPTSKDEGRRLVREAIDKRRRVRARAFRGTKRARKKSKRTRWPNDDPGRPVILQLDVA